MDGLRFKAGYAKWFTVNAAVTPLLEWLSAARADRLAVQLRENVFGYAFQ
jgi:hypothetical protein